MKVSIFFNPLKTTPELIEKNIIPIFSKNGIETVLVNESEVFIDEKHVDKIKQSDYLIVLGGDGSVLRVAKIATEYSIPIVGINLGNLGFLSAFSSDEIELAAQEISHNAISLSERALIACYVNNQKYIALNDLVIQKTDPVGTMCIDLKIGKNVLYSFSGDGIIIATPTGSTAYSLSAGGIIIDPSLNAIEITPLAPHAFNMRPVVVPTKKVIQLTVAGIDSGKAVLVMDGIPITNLDKDACVAVTGNDKTIKLAQRPNDNFYSLLNYKLGFGRRFE